jgi:hypothetical protein
MDAVIKRVAERVRADLGYRGTTPIFYRDDYASDSPGWELGLLRAFGRCAVVVAFYSQTYFARSADADLCCYCGHEIGLFAKRAPEQVANVIPVLWDVPTPGVRRMVPDAMQAYTWVLDARLVTPPLKQKYENYGLRWLWTRQNERIREDMTLAIARKIVALHKQAPPRQSPSVESLAQAPCVFHPPEEARRTVSDLAGDNTADPIDRGTLVLVYLPHAPVQASARAQLEQQGRRMGYLVHVAEWTARTGVQDMLTLTESRVPMVICASPEALRRRDDGALRQLLSDARWFGALLVVGGSGRGRHTTEDQQFTVAAAENGLADGLGEAVAIVKRRLMRDAGLSGPPYVGPSMPRL